MKALQFPLARITVFFVSGIIFGHRFSPPLKDVAFILLLCFVLCALAFVYSVKHAAQRVIFGICIYCFSFLSGLFAYTAQHYATENHYSRQLSANDARHSCKLTIKEVLKSNSINDRYVATVEHIDTKPCTGLILLNLKRAKNAGRIITGATLLVSGQIQRHRPPQNPEQFDYGKYLSQKSIFAQMYADSANVTAVDTLKNLSYYAAAFRNRIISNLEKRHFNKDNLAVITALILGQQQDISKETIQDYQYAGAIHILSVSGLHVGYIMLFVNFMLLRVPKSKSGNIIRLFAVLVSLWGFSFIAGLAPSIVRSATMFSFVAVGLYLKRETYIFHTVLVSLLLILMVSPSFLFDVGFQLSYVSLFFILWLQPFLSRFWTPKTKAAKYFWDIITVSAAAQIGAFPLSVYYFHQFPGLFFVTNLVILPALGIIMAYGVLVMALAFFDAVPGFLSTSLDVLIGWLNLTIRKIASFDQFVVRDIPLNAAMLIVLYVTVIVLFLWLMKPTYRKIVWAICCLLFFQGTLIYNRWKNDTAETFVVFRMKNSSLITEKHGHGIRVYCEDGVRTKVLQDPNLTAYRVANFSKIVAVKQMRNVMYFKRRSIFIADSCGIYPKGIRPDIVLVTQSPKINFERMLNEMKPRQVVADASNFKFYTEHWKASCQKQKIPFHAIAEKGYYQLQ
ncbi:competence protein ComEC [Flavobacterium magnum]|uniref:Competence protein ComEC n=1 Tax=Flavobacterium magnum TaxID=2162713 RepID=A0A2S0REC5_9FLAO|nr:ComEC/Rec2 family competence protein [Flavobacterium magnum]AWA29598.1 competence protein ComEC [Flavobacterium magnum]